MTTEMAFSTQQPCGSTVDEAPPDVWPTNLNDQHAFLEVPEQLQIGLCAVWSFGVPSPSSRKIQHMEDGYTQLGTMLTDQRPEDSEGDGVIVVGRFKGDPYDGVQLSYKAGRRNLYLTLEGALRLAFLLAAAVDRDIDIR
jgi:hypothetical protein